jgi:hypothetical protein
MYNIGWGNSPQPPEKDLHHMLMSAVLKTQVTQDLLLLNFMLLEDYCISL